MSDDVAGILPSIDGHQTPTIRPTQAKLPERLVGIVVGRDGCPLGLDLPSLDERGAADVWKRTLGPGPYYVRFEDREREPPLTQVQRVSRMGECWLDCAIDGIDGALDLLIAGASRLVVWADDPELLESVGDSAVVGWDGKRDLPSAVAAAAPHEVPIIAIDPLPNHDDPGLYQMPPQPWPGRFEVKHVGRPLDDAKDDAE
jgi:hypothetical protein